MDKRRSLGKGLGALLPDVPIYADDQQESEEQGSVTQLPIEKLEINKNQPRKEFDSEKLAELSASIQQSGILQPLLVSPRGEKYLIVAGERRYRAALAIGLTEVPVIIKEVSDDEVLELALIENIQREDLLPIEEARAYYTLTERLNISRTDLASRVGKSRAHVSNMIRLLDLTPHIITLMEKNQLSMGQARALLPLIENENVNLWADKIVKEQLSVREVEKLVRKIQRKHKQEGREKDKKETVRSLMFEEYASQIQTALQTKVEISSKRQGGKIEIKFFSDEELERLVAVLTTKAK